MIDLLSLLSWSVGLYLKVLSLPGSPCSPFFFPGFLQSRSSSINFQIATHNKLLDGFGKGKPDKQFAALKMTLLHL